MTRKIAQVAIPVSLTLDRQFDYLVPDNIQSSVGVGMRVSVPFGPRIVTGYVTQLKNRTAFKGPLKSIIKALYPEQILNKELFKLAETIHTDYFCSLSDAIHTIIPPGLKKSRSLIEKVDFITQRIPFLPYTKDEEGYLKKEQLSKPIVIISDLSDKEKWLVYSALIKKSLNDKKSVIFLVPDYRKISPALECLKLGITPYVLTSQVKPQETLNSWSSIGKNDFSFVAGTRSAIFAPVNNLGLIIIDEESHFAYRQDQVPHYRTAEIAYTRLKSPQSQLVVGDFVPSLETYHLSRQKESALLKITPQEKTNKLCLIDITREFQFKSKGRIISKILEFRMASALENKQKIFIFVPQKGFSTLLYCPHCKKVQTCPRCSCSLTYHFKEKTLSCPKCPYEINAEELCPSCRQTYVRYSGYGAEKVESEISKLFPSTKISFYSRRPDVAHSKEWFFAKSGDVMIATQEIFEDPDWSRYSFDYTCVLDLEKMLFSSDFRSSEKIFSRLLKLLFLAKNELFIQTHFGDNEILRYLQSSDIEAFLKNEISLRQELKLPPVEPMGALLVRSSDQAKALDAATDIYKKMKKCFPKSFSVEIYEPTPAKPFKVRGNFRYDILIKYKALDRIQEKLWALIKVARHGVITTFDPSPL